jgi:hypothetical protein
MYCHCWNFASKFPFLDGVESIRGQTMPYYRIYSVTSDDHIASSPVEAGFADDAEAIQHARSVQDGLDLEVWEGKRRVAVLKAKQKTGRPPNLQRQS